MGTSLSSKANVAPRPTVGQTTVHQTIWTGDVSTYKLSKKKSSLFCNIIDSEVFLIIHSCHHCSYLVW